MSFLLNLKSLLIGSALGLVMAGGACAADQGTAAEAEAMVKKAVAYVKANGSEKAAEEFTNGKTFKDRDLYVSYLDLNGKALGHGANPKLVGKDLIGLKDPDGKPLVQMLVDVGKNKGKGWTENYKFRNPITEKISEKAMYVERVGDNIVCVGIYK